MKRIVIIGNSASGFSCCAQLKKLRQDLELSLITQEKYPAYKAHLLLDFLADKIKLEDLFIAGFDYYESNGIRLFKESKVVEINPRKQQVILKDNTRINYDYLVIASGQRVEVLDIAGRNKDGVFTFYNLDDAINIKNRLAIVNSICIVGEPFWAEPLFRLIAQQNKEVKIISSPPPDGYSDLQNTEWIHQATLLEIIGEGRELKAFKLSNGKVIATSLVIFTSPLIPSSDFLKDTDIRTTNGYVKIDENMRTNYENIFACGSVARKKGSLEKTKSWEEALGEGILAADNLIQLLEKGKIQCQQNF